MNSFRSKPRLVSKNIKSLNKVQTILSRIHDQRHDLQNKIRTEQIYKHFYKQC